MTPEQEKERNRHVTELLIKMFGSPPSVVQEQPKPQTAGWGQAAVNYLKNDWEPYGKDYWVKPSGVTGTIVAKYDSDVWEKLQVAFAPVCDCPQCREERMIAEQPDLGTDATEEMGRKLAAEILLNRSDGRIVIPSDDEWIGFNLLERDMELKHAPSPAKGSTQPVPDPCQEVDGVRTVPAPRTQEQDGVRTGENPL